MVALDVEASPKFIGWSKNACSQLNWKRMYLLRYQLTPVVSSSVRCAAQR